MGGLLGKKPNFDSGRRHMIERHLEPRGISDKRVLGACGSVPRERFIPPEEISQAYDDHPIPIGPCR